MRYASRSTGRRFFGSDRNQGWAASRRTASCGGAGNRQVTLSVTVIPIVSAIRLSCKRVDDYKLIFDDLSVLKVLTVKCLASA